MKSIQSGYICYNCRTHFLQPAFSLYGAVCPHCGRSDFSADYVFCEDEIKSKFVLPNLDKKEK